MKAVLCLGILGLGLAGCTSDATEGGIPAPSWWQVMRGEPLYNNPSTSRISSPNGNRGGGPTWPMQSAESRRTDGSGRVGALQDGTSIGPGLPGDRFPYSVGQEGRVPRGDYSPRLNTSRGPATVYPNNAEAAQSSGSPSLYPRAGQERINPNPRQNPTVYPKSSDGRP